MILAWLVALVAAADFEFRGRSELQDAKKQQEDAQRGQTARHSVTH
jgi:hypothetical protein